MSQQTSYTPGPWIAQRTPVGTILIRAQGRVIAAVDGGDAAEANAVVIQQAPTMHDLLRQMCNRALDSEQAWLDAADECLSRIDGGA